MTASLLQSEIVNITDQLKNKYQAEKVYLFGSAVNNIENANDLDFLIVKSRIPKNSHERSMQIHQYVNKKVAADFIIITPDEFSNHMRMQNPFLLNIVNSGKLLYG